MKYLPLSVLVVVCGGLAYRATVEVWHPTGMVCLWSLFVCCCCGAFFAIVDDGDKS